MQRPSRPTAVLQTQYTLMPLAVTAIFACLVCGMADAQDATKNTDQVKNDEPQRKDSTRQQSETDNDSANLLEFKVRNITFRTFGGVTTVQGDLNVSFTVTNKSNKSLKVDFSKFSVETDGKQQVLRRPVDAGFANPQFVLDQGKSQSGQISFRIQLAPSKEPELLLVWKDEGQKSEVSLNEFLHQQWKTKTTYLGPDKCLAVVELHKALDHPAIWRLAEEFRKLKQQGIDRVVLDVQADSKPATSYTLRMTIGGWLASVKAGQQQQRFPFGMQIQSPVQFDTFLVTGIPDSLTRSQFGSNSVSIQRKTRSRAIADALRTAYNKVPLSEAMEDLHHSEPGVQLVAIEANIDRLTEQQIFDLIRMSEGQPIPQRALLTENLYRVPYASVTEILAREAQSEHAELSRAAVSGLIRSVSPQAVDTVNRIWRESEKAALKQMIVREILSAKDHRYTGLISQYAVSLIDLASATGTPSDQSEAPKKDTPKPASANKGTLQEILGFLTAQDDSGFGQVARDRLLSIRDTEIQDVVMQHILTSLDDTDKSLAQAYIRQRLDAATNPDTRSAQSTTTLSIISTIKRFPDTAYTERLLKMSNGRQISSTVKYEAFRAAIGCANHDQLEEITEQFDTYDVRRKMALLPHLQNIEHPKWLELAQRSLSADRSSRSMALSMLQNHGSLEALEVVLELLDKVMTTAEKKNKIESDEFQVVSTILNNLQTAFLPKARRAINRCNRSSLVQVAQRASDCIRASYIHFYRSSAMQEELRNIVELRKAEKYDEAIALYDRVLKYEPFFASAFVSRGSLHMRVGNHQHAMKDLRRANELNPKSAITESIIAIAQIRLGNIEEGIADGEEILKSIPDLDTIVRRDTIYNTACIYGRAVEVTDDKATKSKYLQRGMELLHDCVHRKKTYRQKFNEVDHFLQDDDLNAFHDQPKWKELVEQVRKNEANANGRG